MQGCGTVFHSVVDPRFWLTDTAAAATATMSTAWSTRWMRRWPAACARFIFTSTMGTLGFNPHGPVTEDIPFNWRDRASA